MPSIDVRLKFTSDQVAALDAYCDQVYQQTGWRPTRSQVIRQGSGQLVQAAGIAWPDDPPRGGDRRSPDS